MEDSYDGGLHSLAEEDLDVVNDANAQVGERPGGHYDRARKISHFAKTGNRFLDVNRSPFRHSYIDVRVFFAFVSFM